MSAHALSDSAALPKIWSRESRCTSCRPRTTSALLVLMTVAAAGGLSAQVTHEPAVCSTEPCIQVGSFNIELLGKARRPYGGQDRPLRTRAQVEELAVLVADGLDLEVVVFQEINTASQQWGWLKDSLEDRGFEFFAVPARIRGLGSFPVRAFARVMGSREQGAGSGAK